MTTNIMPAAAASAQTPSSTQPSQMAQKERSGPLSESTTHLLIAAGCIGQYSLAVRLWNRSHV
jgi:hypothetical protein